MAEFKKWVVLVPQLKKTWQLAWPIIIGNLSLPLLSLADAGILGHLDDSQYLAGVTAGGSIMAYVFWGFNFLSMGLSGFTSQALGKKDTSAIVNQLTRYATVAITLIVVLLLFHRPFIDAGLNIISPPNEARMEANTYLTLRMFGVPAIVFNSMLLGFFVGLQNTRIGLYTLSVTQILNIGLNYLFVYVFEFRTSGIAIGSVISEYMALLLVLWQLKRTLKTMHQTSIEPVQFEFKWSQYLPIFQVSSRLFIRSFILLSAFVWFNRISSTFGELTLAANGLLLAFVTLISYFLDGTAAAAEAQTGYAIGTSDPALLRQSLVSSGLINGLFMIALTMLFFFGSEHLLRLLTSQENVLSIANDQLVWVSLIPLTGGIAFWLDGVFIGARRSLDMRNSVIVAFIGFVMASVFFAKTNTGLWWCFNGFFALRSIWLLRIFLKELL